MTNNAMDKSKKDKRSNLQKKTVQKITGITVLMISILYSREKCEKTENTLTS
jgi:hypothetical protein